MDDERPSKKKKLIDDHLFSIPSSTNQTLPTFTTTMSAKTNTIATKTLLDDAQKGFRKGNFVCSPLSLEFLLTMIASGAKGKTLNQLLGFLGLESMDQLHSETPSSKLFAQLLSNPEGDQGDLVVSLANGAWVDMSLNPILPSYQEVLRTVYQTEAKFVNFRNAPARTVCQINSWVNEKTKGLIPNIIETNDMTQDLAMVLANALYFKGLWSTPFYKENTMELDFHLINGETILVPFMTSYKQFMYGSFEGLKILQIPYESHCKSNKFSMYIFLPDKKDGLHNLLEEFHTNCALFHQPFELRLTALDKLWVPKFKISYRFEAQNVLKQMGLPLPFEPTNKELTGIVDSPDGDMLCVSKIFQKSFIEVNETGTIAAAVSFATICFGACANPVVEHPPRPSFVADHPFMFMIREDTSRAVLFVGVVLNPNI